MRVAFFGTPMHVVPYLDVIAAAHELVAVVTQPDRPRGRSGTPMAPPVKDAALEAGVPVLQPERCGSDETISALSELAIDLFVVAAYGQIMPPHLLALPARRAINVHYSLLPKLRGPAPVQHAILEGLTQTGVTVQYVHERVDRGDVLRQEVVDILPADRTDSLTARLTIVACGALQTVLDDIADDRASARPQDESEATYAHLLTKSAGRIDWTRRATDIHCQIRGCYPWPVAWCGVENPLRVLDAEVVSATGEPGEIVEIRPTEGLVVACGEGGLLLRELQPAGCKRLTAPEYLRGARIAAGDRLE